MAIQSEAVALKEWAVSVKALLEGELIMIMRKGGIAEETRDFRLMDNRFYLMPAYEHQKEHLLKSPYRNKLAATLTEWSPDWETVRLQGYAEVVDDIEIFDGDTLDKLRECHIWEDAFAEERLRWKRKNPLHLLILRVYRLQDTIEIPMRPAYNGCKSWVKLEDDVPKRELAPVLTDEQFTRMREKLMAALS
ncbi:DUF1802 family protein [Paenibacillus sp. J5C_2022]|uniref:DUF1802 family protein n=1 Tax=Paenibacillus sp. J5C2022 TaxID=2977129 RepID=UPI0021D0787A|nr:DUF1802 family protein [Paenibacillus sp. J5C2022]MCU6710398.1 DUF1802 family protein [Paenibacillus sp. J5C2022]